MLKTGGSVSPLTILILGDYTHARIHAYMGAHISFYPEDTRIYHLCVCVRYLTRRNDVHYSIFSFDLHSANICMCIGTHMYMSFLWLDFVIVTRESLCVLSNGVSQVNYILLKFPILDIQFNCSIVKKRR